MLGLAQATRVSSKTKPENRPKAPEVYRQRKEPSSSWKGPCESSRVLEKNQPCVPGSLSYSTPELKKINLSSQTLEVWSHWCVLMAAFSKGGKQVPILVPLREMKNTSTILENGLVIS